MQSEGKRSLLRRNADLMEGLDVLAALKGTDKVLLDTVMQPEVLEQQMQQINDIYFKVFDELYDIIREGDEMAFCYFSSWAPGKMSKLQSDISTMISEDDYRRFCTTLYPRTMSKDRLYLVSSGRRRRHASPARPSRN